jgi:hypothetical protein
MVPVLAVLPGPPGILAANQAFSDAAGPAPLQDRLMKAPLFEQDCIPGYMLLIICQ